VMKNSRKERSTIFLPLSFVCRVLILGIFVFILFVLKMTNQLYTITLQD
jgi:hypothetical protein